MKRPRPFAAFAAVLVVLQFVVLGSGIACAMPGMDNGSARSMTAMRVGRGSMASSPAGSAPRATPAAPHAPVDRLPCHLPWAPADCHGMAPCIPAALGAPAVALLPAPSIAHDRVVLVVLAPPSIFAPPELPPPRA